MSTSLVEMLTGAPLFPQRIVCLTEETTETLFRIGCGDRVVGVSCFTLRPEEARSKPRVSSFLDAKYDDIEALRPDLVIGFSDLQAQIAHDLAKRGIPVVIFNQRSVAEVLTTICATAALVGRGDAGAALASSLATHLQDVEARARTNPRRVRVFFEEWPDPLISGIRWVSELVEIAGGIDICAESRARHDAAGRIFKLDDVAARDPEVIIASWCGKRARKNEIVERFANTTAVKNDQLYEIASELILQPGPAALTDGVAHLARIIAAVARDQQLPAASASELRRAPGSVTPGAAPGVT